MSWLTFSSFPVFSLGTPPCGSVSLNKFKLEPTATARALTTAGYLRTPPWLLAVPHSLVLLNNLSATAKSRPANPERAETPLL
jgi:hypothetical protein